MGSPLVSVIVPNYNHASFLPRRLESILQQTVSDLEVILLDDSSSDNSREVILEFAGKDQRIRPFFNSSNSGSPFRQWKKGIDQARGTYIWIAESDDYADLGLLERLLETIQQNPDVGLAYCQSYFVDRVGEVRGTHLENLMALHPTLWTDDFCMEGKEALANFMPVINIIPNAGAAVFQRSACEYVDWERLFQFRLAGDRFFWSSLLLRTNICFVARPMNYFMIDGETVRSRHINTPGYLNEVAVMVQTINKWVGIPMKTKNRAVRQWIRHFKRARKNTHHRGSYLARNSIKPFFRLLQTYFTR